MTRCLDKKTALFLKTKKSQSDLALSMLYALRHEKKIDVESFKMMLPTLRAGRVFYSKKLKGLKTK